MGLRGLWPAAGLRLLWWHGDCGPVAMHRRMLRRMPTGGKLCPWGSYVVLLFGWRLAPPMEMCISGEQPGLHILTATCACILFEGAEAVVPVCESRRATAHLRAHIVSRKRLPSAARICQRRLPPVLRDPKPHVHSLFHSFPIPSIPHSIHSLFRSLFHPSPIPFIPTARSFLCQEHGANGCTGSGVGVQL